MKKIVLGIADSAGLHLAKNIMDKLLEYSDRIEVVGIVLTDAAKRGWETERGGKDYENYPFDYYAKNNFLAPFASGSARYDTMIVCPCSPGILGKINAGVSDDLLTRAADVIFKERRKLIIVPNFAPYSIIHLKNMTGITEAGGIICPATAGGAAEDVMRLVFEE